MVVGCRGEREEVEAGGALDGSWAPWLRVGKETGAARVIGTPGSLKEVRKSSNLFALA